MIKNLLKILILILILFLLFIGYFAYFGFTTSKFNLIIKDQIKKQNSNFDIDLKKVKLHLDLKNISIKIKTKNPKIILNNSDNIKLNEISSKKDLYVQSIIIELGIVYSMYSKLINFCQYH